MSVFFFTSLRNSRYRRDTFIGIVCIEYTKLDTYKGNIKNMKKLMTVGLLVLAVLGGSYGANTLYTWGGEPNIDGVKKSIDELDGMLQEKKDALSLMDEQKKDMSNQLASKLVELSNKNTELSHSHASITDLTNQKNDANQTISELANSLKESESKQTDKDVLIKDMQEKNAVLLKELNQAKKANTDVIKTAAEHQQEYENQILDLEKELDETNTNYKQLKEQIASLETQKSTLQAKQHDLESESIDKDGQLDQARKDVKELESYANTVVDKHQTN